MKSITVKIKFEDKDSFWLNTRNIGKALYKWHREVVYKGPAEVPYGIKSVELLEYQEGEKAEEVEEE